MEETLWELDRLLRHATALRELLGAAEAMTPDRDEATDPAGAVRVTIGRDGLPESFRVATDWHRRIDAGSLGATVVEAHRAALERRTTERSRLLEERGHRPDSGAPVAESPFRRPPGDARPRPLELIVEDVLRAQDAADAIAAAPAPVPQGTGSTRTRTVRITLTGAGSLSCDADPRWAAEQTGPRLTEALNGALDAARQELAAAMRATVHEAAARDELVAETYTTLSGTP